VLVCRDSSDTRGRRLLFLRRSPSRNPAWLRQAASAESLQPPRPGLQRAGDGYAQAPQRHDGQREATSTSARTAGDGDFGCVGGLEENSPSKATRRRAAGTAGAATVQHPPGHPARRARPAQPPRRGTESDGEQHQRCPPPRAQQGTRKLPFQAEKHLKPRNAQPVSGEDGCTESHQRPSGIKPQLKIYTDNLPRLWGFEVKGSQILSIQQRISEGQIQGRKQPVSHSHHPEPVGISFAPQQRC